MASSTERKTSLMKNASQFLSSREDCFALFLLVARFVNDRIARRQFGAEAFGASGRFSSWLARANWCAKLGQHRGHHPTNLPRRHRAPFGLPGQERVQAQFTGQIHLEKRQATIQLQRRNCSGVRTRAASQSTSCFKKRNRCSSENRSPSRGGTCSKGTT